jgi:uncharacterized caspase-like protein
MSTTQTPRRRIALVIGNSTYHHKDIPALSSPAYDANIIANTLRALGFEVTLRKNQMRSEMFKSIFEFGNAMPGCETTLFFFAGHGVQLNNRNYLVPVNAALDNDASVPGQSVDLSLVLQEIEKNKCSVNLVILDACRINPVGGKFRIAASRGLAKLDHVPKGTAMIYAAEPGHVSVDGDGQYSLLTTGLLSALQGPDLRLEKVLAVASAYVERDSLQVQSPYVLDPTSIQKKFDFRVRAEPDPALTANPIPNSSAVNPTGWPRLPN